MGHLSDGSSGGPMGDGIGLLGDGGELELRRQWVMCIRRYVL